MKSLRLGSYKLLELSNEYLDLVNIYDKEDKISYLIDFLISEHKKPWSYGIIGDKDKNELNNIYVKKIKYKYHLLQGKLSKLSYRLNNNQNDILLGSPVFNLENDKYEKLFCSIKESKYFYKNAIYYLGLYIPTHKYELNSDKDLIFSKTILDLKRKHENVIQSFAQYLDKFIKADIVICTVPSHDKNNKIGGTGEVVKRLCEMDRSRINGNEVLIRTETIQKLSSKGASRNIAVHENSIKVNKEIAEKNILLIDDITTSGNSLYACKEKLLDSRASHVTMLVLGKTI